MGKQIIILDRDRSVRSLYEEALGETYRLSFLDGLKDLEGAVDTLGSDRNFDSLLAVLFDPHHTDISVKDLLLLRWPRGFKPPHVYLVTAEEDPNIILFLLNAGVYDFILKPIRKNELRIKLEHSALHAPPDSRFLEVESLGLSEGDLTFREYQILKFLLNCPKHSASRDLIYDSIWGKTVVSKKTLDVHIFNLRRKLRVCGHEILCQGHEFVLKVN